MSTKPVISQFNQVASLLVQEYERYLPTAFDESLSLLEKVNKIIQKMNELGVVTNDVITQWNEVMEWVMNEGLAADVNARLDEMVADGTMDTIINQNIFSDLNLKVDSVVSDVSLLNKKAVVVKSNTRAEIQVAIDKAVVDGVNSVFIPKANGLYSIDSPIKLPSNMRIFSDGATLQSVVVNPLGGGSYSSRIFENLDLINGNENIFVNGLIFDGNRDTATQSAGAFDGVDNLIRFENVTHLTINNCVFKNHTSNWLTSGSSKPMYSFSAVAIVGCDDVEMNNDESYNHRTEGIMIHSSKNVKVSKLYSFNETIWTSLHFWYCDGVTFTDSYVYENNDSGSLVNATAKNMMVKNNYLYGGSGLDISNETTQAYPVENIRIEGNTIINNSVNAIYGAPSEMKKNLVIVSNYLESQNDPLRIGLSEQVVISDNTLLSKGDIDNGIAILESIDGCIIKNNRITASKCVFMGNVNGSIIKNVKIIDNLLISKPIGANGSYSYGAGVMFRQHSSITNLSFENIDVIGNTIKSEGSFVYALIEGVPTKANNLRIENNYMYTDTIANERGVFITLFTNVKVNGNTIVDANRSTLGAINLEVMNNKFLFPTIVVPAYPLYLNTASTGGFGKITGNYAESTGFLRTAHSFTKYVIKDNIPESHYSDVKISKFGITANRPPSPQKGDWFFDTTLNKSIVFNGVNWVDNNNGSTV